MATYISLMKWTDQGRANIGTLADRTKEVQAHLEDMGIRLISLHITMGRYDQVAVFEAPDDETVARAQAFIAGRGNVTSETMRAFDIEEVGRIL